MDEQQETPIHGVLAVEGVETGDQRKFTQGALTWRTLPLPLLWQKYTGDRHDGSVVVGHIDSIERFDLDGATEIAFAGALNHTAEADEVRGLIASRSLRGVSVDVDSAMMELQSREGAALADGDIVGPEDVVETLTKGRISAATLCAIPAFQEAYIALGTANAVTAAATVMPEFSKEEAKRIEAATPEQVPGVLREIAEENPDAAEGILAIASRMEEAWADERPAPEDDGETEPEEGSTDTGEIDAASLTTDSVQVASLTADGVVQMADLAPGLTEDGPGWLTHPVETDRLRDYWTHGIGAAKIGWGLPGDFYRCEALTAQYIEPQHLAGYCANRHKDALGGWPGQNHSGETITASAGEQPAPAYRLVDASEEYSLVASAAPAVPPMDWFANPGLMEPAPLTVTKEGRVFGHVATWGTCHVGFEDSCVSPPSSASEYAYFCSGVVETDGGDVRCGQVTFDTGHADLQLNSSRTLAHYDNTGTCAADVMAGEDEHGIWVAGAMRPEITDEQIRKIRGSKMSGDWRAIGGQMELVAVLAVNTPGFPIPRPALAASAGRQTALVAAGLVPDQKVENFTVDEVVAAAIRRIREQEAASEAIREAQSEIAAFDIKQATMSVLTADDIVMKEN